jgi:hypothetical protein
MRPTQHSVLILLNPPLQDNGAAQQFVLSTQLAAL